MLAIAARDEALSAIDTDEEQTERGGEDGAATDSEKERTKNEKRLNEKEKNKKKQNKTMKKTRRVEGSRGKMDVFRSRSNDR